MHKRRQNPEMKGYTAKKHSLCTPSYIHQADLEEIQQKCLKLLQKVKRHRAQTKHVFTAQCHVTDPISSFSLHIDKNILFP